MYRRRFRPPVCDRDYKTLFVIAVEGDVTEKSYFERFGSTLNSAIVEIEVLPPLSHSAPQHVMQKLEQYVKNKVKNTYQLWMVVDRDQWNAGVLTKIRGRCVQKGYGFCISNSCYAHR
ncbi:MAG: RloB family protein [Planctomycetaceae bacterium]|jgi:hypothetical protein|nr:RloB family protein [Planctomycetaceae bacterium]